MVGPHPFVDLRGVTLLSEDGDVVDRGPTLAHHPLKVPVAERVAAVPTDAELDDVGRVVPPLEGRGVTSHERTCGRD